MWPRRLAHPWAKWTLFKKIYLFIITVAALGLCSCTQAFATYGKWGPLSSCSAWTSHCSGFSCCGAQALEHRLSSRGAWA